MGKVIGFELNSQEPERAATFYDEVFGWEISEPHWDYRTISTGHQCSGILPLIGYPTLGQ